jgi:phenylacetate-CoA ligase
VLEAADRLEHVSRLPNDELLRLQADELRHLLQHAATYSDWWQRHIGDVNLDAVTPIEMLAGMPVTTREFLQQHLDDMVVTVPGTPNSDYPVQKTSGSGGRPVQVVKYWPHYSVVIDSITILEWRWHRRDLSKRIGLFRLGAKAEDSVFPGPPLTYLGDMPPLFSRSSVDSTVDELLEALVRFQPGYLLTNPITLRLVALEQLRSPRPISPIHQIITLADRVSPELRELTRQAFGARIVDRYSSVEFNVIALQCPVHDHLHQIVPNVHIEVLDEYDQPVPHGQPGRAVITGLQGAATPLLRYELGDIITMADQPCDTGITWPVISDVHGRVRSSAIGADGSRKLITLFTADFLHMRQIREFRLVRFDDGAIVVVHVDDALNDTQRERLITSIQRDVFREPLPVTVLESLVPLSPPRWKVREIYFLTGKRDPHWTAGDIDQLLVKVDTAVEQF